MAKQQLNWKKTTTETISAKGILDETATIITYKDEDGDPQQIAISELLNKFASCEIQFTIKMQSDEVLDINDDTEKDNDQEYHKSFGLNDLE